ncbi:glycosyltransferase family 2 protein [Sphingobium aquiterrae]|uniref:glycosyltransferase family 2 protein n=1 Tax=Sphingobium aquiterrae TaxID=2038656 RepID=UPI00301A6B07
MLDPRSRLAIVIVNYFKADRILENVEALTRQTIAPRLRVVVVDNSADEAERAPLRNGLPATVQLIILPRNVGYSRGVNLAALNARPFEDILLLNPDIVLDDPEALETLLGEFQAQRDIGVMAALQSNDDGTPVEVARRFPNLVKQVIRRLKPGAYTDHDVLRPLLERPRSALLDVDWVQSSFTLVRGDIWEQIGGLDERYEIFMSDVALCQSVHELGYRVVVSSAVTVRADGLRASRGGLSAVFHSRALRVHVRDAVKYQMRNFFRIPRRGPVAIKRPADSEPIWH